MENKDNIPEWIKILDELIEKSKKGEIRLLSNKRMRNSIKFTNDDLRGILK